jgi:hypothetical protein
VYHHPLKSYWTGKGHLIRFSFWAVRSKVSAEPRLASGVPREDAFAAVWEECFLDDDDAGTVAMTETPTIS